MIHARFLIPIAIYAAIALALLVLSRRAGGLLCVLAASYCGVIVVTFTRGATGAIWLVQLLLLLLVPVVLRRPAMPAFGSTTVSRLTYAVFVVYLVGVGIALLRYDPSLEALRAGAFTSVAGIPLSVLMAGYRVLVIATLVLAFTLPLRYYVDRATLLRCLVLCWVLSVVMAVAGLIHSSGALNLGFTIHTDVVDVDLAENIGRRQGALLGFYRATSGMMLVFGIFLSYAMTQMTKSVVLKAMAWASAPVLMISLLLTWSRSAMLAMAAGSISLIITLGGRRAIWGIVLTVFGIVVVYGVLSSYEDVAERMRYFETGEMDESIRARLVTWGALLGYLLQAPDVLFFGAGFQNFNYALHVSEKAVPLVAAHNNYLHILGESGIFGLAIFLGWLGSVFVWLLKWRALCTDQTTKVMTGILMSMVIATMTGGLTQDALAPSHSRVAWIPHFYLVLGMWISWYRAEMWLQCQRVGALHTPAMSMADLLPRHGRAPSADVC